MPLVVSALLLIAALVVVLAFAAAAIVCVADRLEAGGPELLGARSPLAGDRRVVGILGGP